VNFSPNPIRAVPHLLGERREERERIIWRGSREVEEQSSE
jgi:hypothetical protein